MKVQAEVDLIYVCEYDGTADDAFLEKCAAGLPFSLKKGWAESAQWGKVRARILAWMLLAYALCCHRETSAADGTEDADGFFWQNEIRRLAICRNAHGRPYSSAQPELQFNLSHCDEACACIVSDQPAGIDVERRFPYRARLEQNICHEEELELLRCLTVQQREQWLWYLWSLKESFVKLDGRGLGYGMKNANFAGLIREAMQESGETADCRGMQQEANEAADSRRMQQNNDGAKTGPGIEQEMGGAALSRNIQYRAGAGELLGDPVFCMAEAADTYTLASCSMERQAEVRRMKEQELCGCLGM